MQNEHPEDLVDRETVAAAVTVKINLESPKVEESKIEAAAQASDDSDTKLDKFHYSIGLEYMENLF